MWGLGQGWLVCLIPNHINDHTVGCPGTPASSDLVNIVPCSGCGN